MEGVKMCQLYSVPRSSFSRGSVPQVLICLLMFFIVILAVFFNSIYDRIIIISKLSDEDYVAYKELKKHFDKVAEEQCGEVGDGTLTWIVSKRDRILKKYGISQRSKWVAYDVYKDPDSETKFAEAF